MTSMENRRQWSIQKVLTVTILLSVAAGGLAGYGLGYAFQYQAPTIREYFLFNTSVDLNESLYPKIPDTFFPDHLTANRGDTIVIHYINTESASAGGDRHSFTMLAPYAFNGTTGFIVDPGRNANITFVADLPGVFRYYCIFHEPTMRGYLTVLG
jgi:plastocyanin